MPVKNPSASALIRRAQKHLTLSQPAQAQKVLMEVLQKYPGNSEAKNLLTVLQPHKLNIEESKIQVRRIATLYKRRKFKEAEELTRFMLSQQPNNAALCNLMARVHLAQSKPFEALNWSKKSLEINSTQYSSYIISGDINMRLRNYRESIEMFSKAIKDSKQPDLITRKIANCLSGLGQVDEALETLNSVLQNEPNDHAMYEQMGSIFQSLSQFDASIEMFEKALAIKPNSLIAHMPLSRIKQYPAEKHLPKIEKLISTVKPDTEAAGILGITKANSFLKQGDHKKYISELIEANKVLKKTTNFRMDQFRKKMEASMRPFDKDLHKASKLPAPNEHDPKMIFILGMPRSGTTLTEQIISSHSQVFGAGELPYMASCLLEALAKARSTENIFTENHLESIRSKYLDLLQQFSYEETYITDKMPHNFTLAGYILCAFPEAKIVHLVRDARAVGWSNFSNYFQAEALSYSFDQEQTADIIKLEHEFMEYWDKKFPGRIYNLDYEKLTTNQEEESRKLIEYCGLEWQDQCLDFQDNERAIKTASDTQVRQKMYTHRKEAWRRYEEELQPMLTRLREHKLVPES